MFSFKFLYLKFSYTFNTCDICLYATFSDGNCCQLHKLRLLSQASRALHGARLNQKCRVGRAPPWRGPQQKCGVFVENRLPMQEAKGRGLRAGRGLPPPRGDHGQACAPGLSVLICNGAIVVLVGGENSTCQH